MSWRTRDWERRAKRPLVDYPFTNEQAANGRVIVGAVVRNIDDRRGFSFGDIDDDIMEDLLDDLLREVLPIVVLGSRAESEGDR